MQSNERRRQSPGGNQMSQSDEQQPSGEGQDPSQGQQVRASHVSARVPEDVSRGVFTTGMILMTGGTEFVLDFVQNMGRSPQVAARVVMPHAALPQFADALRKNLDIYRNRFGEPPALPKAEPPARRPTPQEIYDDLKMHDDVLSGAYANGVMISHTPSDFSFDFLTNFFPHSAVSCRVFLSASQAPRILESLDGTYKQFQQRVRQQQPPPPNPHDPGEPPADASGGQPNG